MIAKANAICPVCFSPAVADSGDPACRRGEMEFEFHCPDCGLEFVLSCNGNAYNIACKLRLASVKEAKGS